MSSVISFLLSLAAVAAVMAVPVLIVLKRSHLNKKMAIISYLFAAIFLLRFYVSYNSLPADSLYDLNLFERLSDSFLHTLQTFSMDEGYTEYTVIGKAILEADGHALWAVVYGAVVSVLNVCAPIAGGALLLEILTGVFPTLRLALYPFRPKYIFSEMNEHAILLAEDIFRLNDDQKLMDLDRRPLFRPLLVFTDAYLDEEAEMSAELFERAKAIGAICIKKDLMHLRLKRTKTICYLLMDLKASQNVSIFAKLMETAASKERGGLWPDPGGSGKEKVRAYIFVKDAVENSLISRIRERYPQMDERILVRCIRDDANAALNLIEDVPLFLPFQRVSDSRPRLLSVSIIGSGSLAEEVYKTVFWAGQIPNVSLRLRLVSEKAREVEKHLNMTCPELIESCRAWSPVLKLCESPEDDRYNPPYASLSFDQVEAVDEIMSYPKDVLEKTDYYVISTGSDEKNIRTAEQLRILLSRRNTRGKRPGRKVVIAPALYDDRLAEAVRQYNTDDERTPAMCPFGMAGIRCSCQNVFMTRQAESARTIHRMYTRENCREESNDEYSYWSDIARTLHAPYKMFGIGASGELMTDEERNLLTWTEHRRWNAYLRSLGFVCASKEQHEWLFRQYGAHKGLLEKLHPCLVESALFPEPFNEIRDYDPSRHDMLDLVTMRAYLLDEKQQEKAFAQSDVYFKKFDDPIDYDSALRPVTEDRFSGDDNGKA